MPDFKFGAYADSFVYRPRVVVKVISVVAPLVGAKTSSYSNTDNRVSNVRTNEDVTRLGAVAEVYDPEWNAWLAGEI